MQVFRDISEIRDDKASVVAIGSFDGVHLGHRHILQWLCATAKEHDCRSVVVTFDPHPQQVLHPEEPFFTINTLQKNLSLMEAQGVDAVLVLPFTMELAACDYREFLQRYVFDALHARYLLMGPNHTIGHHKEGTGDAIARYCEEHQVQVVPIPEYMLHKSGVHSAAIRTAIVQNDRETVEELLGYAYDMPSVQNEEK
ncbi:MAG: adenylyltransferase/cytidyltransferase family protein [Bacteroidales bacterium]|nr:adenylyltransferase/cytidyltransferase family protein [Bacteroidales bacterium]